MLLRSLPDIYKECNLFVRDIVSKEHVDLCVLLHIIPVRYVFPVINLTRDVYKTPTTSEMEFFVKFVNSFI